MHNIDAVTKDQVLAEIADIHHEMQNLTTRKLAISSRPCDLPIIELTDRLNRISERLEYLEPFVIESNQLIQEIEHLKVVLAQRNSLANELQKIDDRINQLVRRMALIRSLGNHLGMAIEFPTNEG